MHLKDLDIDIPYRTTNGTYGKGSSNLLVKRMYLKRINFGGKKFGWFGRSAKPGTIWWNLFWRIERKI